MQGAREEGKQLSPGSTGLGSPHEGCTGSHAHNHLKYLEHVGGGRPSAKPQHMPPGRPLLPHHYINVPTFLGRAVFRASREPCSQEGGES